MTFLLGGAVAWMWGKMPNAASDASQTQSATWDPDYFCDLKSDETAGALAEALRGEPDATNPFIELSVSCPGDLRMYQLVAAIEIAFPRDPSRRALAASNLSASMSLTNPGSEEAHRAALALALMALESRACGSTEAVLERLSALGIKDARIKAALDESLKRRGGETEPCLNFPLPD